ncbi:MAG: amino acid adenylation domain-containing protein, partial [Candidatus Aminicenantes bacterium]|nr:amino acid adenylation domain-containing protein [Candidatus Aminicenantes bacterium]
KNALRVLFLDLSQYFTSDYEMLYDVVEPPLGGMYVMTYLKEKLAERVDIKILKSRIDFDSYNELEELLAEFKPQVIGVRSLTFYRDFFHRTIQVMRQWGIDVPIIAGGPYATRNYDSLLQDKNIDLLVKSEGETTFCEIIEKIIENGGRLPADEELKKIGGIGFIPKNGETKKQYARQIFILDELAAALSRENPANLQPFYRSADPAYIIFTSGSTGKPKGVLAEQRNVVNTLNWFAQRYDLHPDVQVIQLSNTTFDPSVEQIFATLLSGATLHLPEHKEIILDRESFRAFVQRQRISIVNFVPGTLKELLGSGDKLSSLQTVIAGGEKLEQFVNNRIIENGYQLHNHYGPTETTIDALAEKCSANEKVRLGRPIDNVSCYILGKNRELMPVGVPGELYIGGAGVTRGYLNNPELTADRFLIHNRSYNSYKSHRSYAEKIYKTGDLAYWLPEGKIEFLGRIDEQVKVRGFRIELGEIETQLRQHKEVKDAVVTALEAQETGDKFLCAYYVARENRLEPSELDGVELRSYLSETLPDYMIPAYFIRLDNIPLNPNGKVDRSALPRPHGDDSRVDYEAPRDEIEETLADIWGDVLGRKKGEIGIDSNFFEIGGDSIKVIQISARLRKFGMRLESGDLFLNPTIRMLRGRIKNIERKIDQGTVTGEVRLSPVQAWFFSENILERHHYNMAAMLFSAAGFEEETVRAVFSRIQEHHDALRMTFREENGRIIQTAHGLDYPLSLQVYDFTSDSTGKQAAELLLAKVNNIQAGIDLENGPLMKLGLFHLADGDRLLIVIHHLVIDGISWHILFKDIATLYRQSKLGQPFSLPPKTDSYRYWCERLWQYANDESFLSAERDFWKHIETEKVDEITADFPAANLRADTQRRHIELNEEQTELLLSDVNRAFGTQIDDILLTSLALGARATFNINRVLVALEEHGRQTSFKEIDISRTVGWFASIYPVILDVTSTDDMTAAENLARQIKKIKETLHRIPNRGVGCGILKYLTAPEHKKGIDLKLQPRIGFNYLGQFDSDVENRSFGIAQESAGMTQSPKGEQELELDISGIISDKKLKISVSYSSRRFKSQTIDNFLDSYKTSLVSIITFCLGRQEKELTPSDLDYKDLSIEELDTIFD